MISRLESSLGSNPSTPTIICKLCNRKYIYNRKAGHRKEVCNSCYVNRKRFKIKEYGVEKLGGKCNICGYDKCLGALQFHHIDPLYKEFTISGSHCMSKEKIDIELEKCILLCANCHSELHYKP